MHEGYALEWLDDLISVKLNPARTRLGSISGEEISVLQNRIEEEKAKIIGSIKNLIFSMESESKIVFGVRQFHLSLITLLDQAMRNKICNSKYPELKQILGELIRCIKELLLLIEDRFADHLTKNEGLPSTYFNHLRKELLARISKIGEHLEKLNQRPSAEILIKVLNGFLVKSTKEHTFTFQEISYIKELCSRVESIEMTVCTVFFFGTG